MQYYFSDYIWQAEKYARKYNLQANPSQRGLNDEIDAFRHTFMQAMMCIKVNDKYAQTLGTGYENITSILREQAPKEKNMDLWNNAIGREIGKEVKLEIKDKNYTKSEIEDIVAKKVVERINTHELITDPYNDNRKYDEKSFRDRIFDLKNRVFHKNEITQKDLDNTELKNAYIDQILDNKELPTKEELDKKVLYGSLIYVDSYKRSDGTTVSGYYRAFPHRKY